jgi:macrodomain Ter protein organizer (MatP/YcbG family)
MKQNRLRTKMFQVWLNPKEYEFLASYAETNMMTASETVRGWIHEVMKKEGYEIKEPSLPEPSKTRKGAKK